MKENRYGLSSSWTDLGLILWLFYHEIDLSLSPLPECLLSNPTLARPVKLSAEVNMLKRGAYGAAYLTADT